MLTIACSSKKIKDGLKDIYLSNIGLDSDLVEFLYYENDNSISLSALYNKVLLEAKYDRMVFLHDDLDILTDNWGKIILANFDNNPTFGIIGIAGTTKLEDTAWWRNVGFTKGIVNHINKDGKVYETKFSEDLGENIARVVCVDGLFFSVDRTKIKCKFDEDFSGFHYYDLGFSLPNALQNVMVGVVTNIRVTHNSIGEVNEEWHKNKLIFEQKYGAYLPVEYKISIKKEQIINSLINERGFKKYLEVGSENGDLTLENINIEHKTKVKNIETEIDGQTFDMILIDGLHFAEVVECDINQALSILNENGIIVVHDCMPSTESEQEINNVSENSAWTGDVWKAWIKLRYNTEFLTYTFNTDYGVGVIDTSIKVDKELPIPIILDYMGKKEYSQMKYREYAQNKNELLNLIDINGR